jgi:Zn-dependent protease with chaperone function
MDMRRCSRMRSSAPSQKRPDDTAGERRAGPLDPFVLPAETGLRLVLVGLAVIAATLVTYAGLWTESEQYSERTTECTSTFTIPRIPLPGQPAPSGPPPGPSPETVAAQEACKRGLAEDTAVWMLAGVSLLALVTAVIYATAPAVKLRRERLRPLTEDEVPQVAVELRGLATEVGVAPAPVWVWNPLHPQGRAVAFGQRRRPYIALGAGLVARFFRNRDEFRAVALHELAHIRNGDLERTYIVMALWRAFLVVAILPIAVWLLSGSADRIGDLLWSASVLAIAVLLARNAFLRRRELYADVRACRSGAPVAAYRRVLRALRSGSQRSARRTLDVHPEPSEREIVLSDTRSLFAMSGWDAFLAGFAGTLVFAGLAMMIAAATGDQVDFASGPPSATAAVLAAAIAAPPAASVLAIGAARITVAASARGARPSVARLGFAMGGGVVAGFLVGFYDAGFSAVFGSTYGADAVAERAAFSRVALVLLLVAGAGLAAACVVMTRHWLRRGARPSKALVPIYAGVASALWTSILAAFGALTPAVAIALENDYGARAFQEGLRGRPLPPESVLERTWRVAVDTSEEVAGGALAAVAAAALVCLLLASLWERLGTRAPSPPERLYLKLAASPAAPDVTDAEAQAPVDRRTFPSPRAASYERARRTVAAARALPARVVGAVGRRHRSGFVRGEAVAATAAVVLLGVLWVDWYDQKDAWSAGLWAVYPVLAIALFALGIPASATVRWAVREIGPGLVATAAGAAAIVLAAALATDAASAAWVAAKPSLPVPVAMIGVALVMWVTDGRPAVWRDALLLVASTLTAIAVTLDRPESDFGAPSIRPGAVAALVALVVMAAGAGHGVLTRASSRK